MKGNGKILVCVPSRGRPQVVREMLGSFDVTTFGFADLIVRTGEKDPEAHRYAGITSEFNDVQWYHGPDEGFGWPTAGYCMAIEDIVKRFPDYSYYMMLEDDCLLLQRNWDKWVVEQFAAMPNHIGLIHLASSIHALIASREWIDTLGFFLPPVLREHGFSGLMEIGTDSGSMIEGTGCPIDHRPVSPGRGRAGFVYTGYPETRTFWAEDEMALSRWRQDELPGLVSKILEARR